MVDDRVWRSMSVRVRSSRIVGGVFLLASSMAVTCPAVIPERLPAGNWGGDHIGMVVTDTAASIEYDCASGTIVGALRLDPSGSFDWQGLHYVGHGGPVSLNEVPDVHPARYTGRATSTTLDMTVTLTDGYRPAMTYHLDRGRAPRVFKCL